MFTCPKIKSLQIAVWDIIIIQTWLSKWSGKDCSWTSPNDIQSDKNLSKKNTEVQG